MGGIRAGQYLIKKATVDPEILARQLPTSDIGRASVRRAKLEIPSFARDLFRRAKKHLWFRHV
jgi:hypothetical protein